MTKEELKQMEQILKDDKTRLVFAEFCESEAAHYKEQVKEYQEEGMRIPAFEEEVKSWLTLAKFFDPRR